MYTILFLLLFLLALENNGQKTDFRKAKRNEHQIQKQYQAKGRKETETKAVDKKTSSSRYYFIPTLIRFFD